MSASRSMTCLLKAMLYHNPAEQNQASGASRLAERVAEVLALFEQDTQFRPLAAGDGLAEQLQMRLKARDRFQQRRLVGQEDRLPQLRAARGQARRVAKTRGRQRPPVKRQHASQR